MTTILTKKKLLLIGLSFMTICCNQGTKTNNHPRQNTATTKMYPEKFDRTKMTSEEHLILAELIKRRKLFDKFLNDYSIKLFTCPGCSYPTLNKRGSYEICIICDWEDDNQDDARSDEIWGGPNSNLSLTENRLNIGKLLKNLADSLNGTINENPKEVISILSYYDNRIKTKIDQIQETKEISSKFMLEYQHETENLLNDLIKRK